MKTSRPAGPSALPGHGQELAPLAAELEGVALVVRRVHQEGQRHLEGLGHLEAVERQFEGRLHQRHHGRDDKAVTVV